MTFPLIVRMGRTQDGSAFAKIEFDGAKLSITGVVGPTCDGNCRGSCGQIEMSLEPEHFTEFAPGWDAAKVSRFLEIWRRWHLNDMTAGSPAQEEWLRANPVPPEEYTYPKSHYEVASAKLAAAGLNPDPNYLVDHKPYKYGHAWLKEGIPAEVIAELHALPRTDKKPAWV